MNTHPKPPQNPKLPPEDFIIWSPFDPDSPQKLKPSKKKRGSVKFHSGTKPPILEISCTDPWGPKSKTLAGGNSAKKQKNKNGDNDSPTKHEESLSVVSTQTNLKCLIHQIRPGDGRQKKELKAALNMVNPYLEFSAKFEEFLEGLSQDHLTDELLDSVKNIYLTNGVEYSRRNCYEFYRREQIPPLLPKMKSFYRHLWSILKESQVFTYFLDEPVRLDYRYEDLNGITDITKDQLMNLVFTVDSGTQGTKIPQSYNPIRSSSQILKFFFVIYEHLCSPYRLLSILIQQYSRKPPLGLSRHEARKFNKKKYVQRKTTVLNFLQKWIEFRYEDFKFGHPVQHHMLDIFCSNLLEEKLAYKKDPKRAPINGDINKLIGIFLKQVCECVNSDTELETDNELRYFLNSEPPNNDSTYNISYGKDQFNSILNSDRLRNSVQHKDKTQDKNKIPSYFSKSSTDDETLRNQKSKSVHIDAAHFKDKRASLKEHLDLQPSCSDSNFKTSFLMGDQDQDNTPDRVNFDVPGRKRSITLDFLSRNNIILAGTSQFGEYKDDHASSKAEVLHQDMFGSEEVLDDTTLLKAHDVFLKESVENICLTLCYIDLKLQRKLTCYDLYPKRLKGKSLKKGMNHEGYTNRFNSLVFWLIFLVLYQNDPAKSAHLLVKYTKILVGLTNPYSNFTDYEAIHVFISTLEHPILKNQEDIQQIYKQGVATDGGLRNFDLSKIRKDFLTDDKNVGGMLKKLENSTSYKNYQAGSIKNVSVPQMFQFVHFFIRKDTIWNLMERGTTPDDPDCDKNSNHGLMNSYGVTTARFSKKNTVSDDSRSGQNECGVTSNSGLNNYGADRENDLLYVNMRKQFPQCEVFQCFEKLQNTTQNDNFLRTFCHLENSKLYKLLMFEYIKIMKYVFMDPFSHKIDFDIMDWWKCYKSYESPKRKRQKVEGLWLGDRDRPVFL